MSAGPVCSFCGEPCAHAEEPIVGLVCLVHGESFTPYICVDCIYSKGTKLLQAARQRLMDRVFASTSTDALSLAVARTIGTPLDPALFAKGIKALQFAGIGPDIFFEEMKRREIVHVVADGELLPVGGGEPRGAA